MAHDNHQNPDQTGYEYFNEAIVVTHFYYVIKEVITSITASF